MRALPPSAGRALAWTLLAAGALHFLLAGVLRPILRPYGYASDFATFYAAGHAFARGTDAYDRAALDAMVAPEFAGWVGHYYYPPPFAATLVRPFAALPLATARRLWIVFEATAFLVAVALLLRRFLAPAGLWAVCAAGAAVLLFTPMRVDLKLGSVSGILLLLFALHLEARARGGEWRAALTLASMIVLKLAPAVLLFYLFCRGEMRRIARTLLAIVGLLVLSLPWTGIQSHRTYVRHVLPELFHEPFAWFTNQSIDAFFTRILVPNPDTSPWIVAPGLATLLTVLASLVVLAALAAVARRDARRADASACGLALALVASLLLARVTWEAMLVLSLPLFLLAARAAGDEATRRPLQVTWALAYALCALPFPYAASPYRAGAGLLLESPRLYGMLLLFATVVMLRLRRI